MQNVVVDGVEVRIDDQSFRSCMVRLSQVERCS
jgi:hypothetical protein